MLKIASKDNVVKVAVERRMSGLQHQATAAAHNSQKVQQAGKMLRRQHGDR